MRNKNGFMIIMCSFLLLVGCSDKASDDNVTNLTNEEKKAEGTSSDQDKELSCKGIEEIYSLSKYDAENFQKAIHSISPSGWTSIAESLKQTGNELKNNDDATNVIYLVSDGEETCGGKPAEVAKALAKSNINPIINVIGLSVTSEDALPNLRK